MKFIHMLTLSLVATLVLILGISPMIYIYSKSNPASEPSLQSSIETTSAYEPSVAQEPEETSTPLALIESDEETMPTEEPTTETEETEASEANKEDINFRNLPDTTEFASPTDTISTTEPATTDAESDFQNTLEDKLLPDTMTIDYEWNGDVLTARKGYVYGPSGKETWYNLDMAGVIWLMEKEGIYLEYWVDEETGLKMYGDYIMCAADLSKRPRGTIVQTSLGLAIVCDFCRYAADSDPTHTHIDIATAWK